VKWCAVIASMVAALVAAAGAGPERMLVADLEVPGGTLRMVLRLTEGGDATIDIPLQGVERMVLEVSGRPTAPCSCGCPCRCRPSWT